MRLAVLISGNGSNLQAIIDLCRCASFPAEVALVISNKESAYGLVRAEKEGIKTLLISNKDYKTRDAFDLEIMKQLDKHSVDLVCLAGFMRIITSRFVDKWFNKIINIHPSLLPSFKGVNAIEQAYESGVKYTGCTVHYVREDVDNGPIIAQAVTNIDSKDTVEDLATKIHTLEHQLYPLAIELIAKKHLSFVDQDSIVIADDCDLVTSHNINF